MSKTSAAQHLDMLLTAYEDAVLAASDREILADRVGAADAATSDFIAAALASRRATALPPLVERRPARGATVRRVIPRDAAGRRRLLGRLIATRPGLPTHISMAFKSREPDDAEVAEMLDELLRDGDGPVSG